MDETKIRLVIVTDVNTKNDIDQALASSTDLEIIGTATNTQEGLRKTADLHPDILLINLDMLISPQNVQSFPFFTAEIILILPHSLKADDLKGWLKIGIEHFILTPVDKKELLNTIYQAYGQAVDKQLSSRPNARKTTSSKKQKIVKQLPSEPKVGKITYDEKLKLTPKLESALERLAELGVDVSLNMGGKTCRLLIPHDLLSPLYIEIGYLIAQLGDETFPKGYKPLSDHPSKIYDRAKQPGPVEFVDSNPSGLKYRVRSQE